MSNAPLLSLIAVLAIVPLVVAGCKSRLQSSPFAWLLLGSAVLGGALPAIAELSAAWSFGLGSNLNVSAALVLLVFAATAAVSRAAFGLAPLVGIYAILILVLACVVSQIEPAEPAIRAPGAWFGGHVVLATASYGALTLAAIAACAVLILEHDLKRKSATWIGKTLPPLNEADGVLGVLLRVAALLMLLALLTGIANEYLSTGRLLAFTHKILLSVLSFLVICFLLYLNHRTGLRGRRAARFVLAGFVLLTIAYPGVKFVREFLLS